MKCTYLFCRYSHQGRYATEKKDKGQKYVEENSKLKHGRKKTKKASTKKQTERKNVACCVCVYVCVRGGTQTCHQGITATPPAPSPLFRYHAICMRALAQGHVTTCVSSSVVGKSEYRGNWKVLRAQFPLVSAPVQRWSRVGCACVRLVIAQSCFFCGCCYSCSSWPRTSHSMATKAWRPARNDVYF